ncbi:MAG: ABC transporter permease [Alphaproteobacteria bacterium]|nr:ABC transporter permease [Alphaproteobacteria bacterium]
MNIAEFFQLALAIIWHGDHDLIEVVGLSLFVSLSAVGLAALIGVPLGGLLATARFPGRAVVIVLINALMGLPPVVVGLMIYLLLSRAGPLGVFGLLYTPTAMIIAQMVLILPIITALTRQTVEHLSRAYDEQLHLFGLKPFERTRTLIFDGRFELLTAVLAGLGRAMAEVGAVIIVGGNIDHFTRVMTTAITLETSRGNLVLALALGVILITLTVIINAVVVVLRWWGERRYGLD